MKVQWILRAVKERWAAWRLCGVSLIVVRYGLAVTRFAFRHAFRALHASIPRNRVGTTVNINNIYYGDQVTEQIILKNSNISGSAIGSGATAAVGDIAAYQTLVDQSTNLDADLKVKLKQAKDAIGQAGLTETDRRDALDDLGKLTEEMRQKAPEAGRVRRLWKRINEVAPTASAILASAVSIAKLIGMVHGVATP